MQYLQRQLESLAKAFKLKCEARWADEAEDVDVCLTILEQEIMDTLSACRWQVVQRVMDHPEFHPSCAGVGQVIALAHIRDGKVDG